MAMKLKLTTVGNSTGIILPKELLEKLRVERGDVLHLTETPDGFKLSPFDTALAAQLDVAEKIMRKRRTLLRKLAE